MKFLLDMPVSFLLLEGVAASWDPTAADFTA
jgi:hypothetical protein